MNKTIGLTTKEVEERIQANEVNYDTNIKSKSLKKILKDNICTLFNFLNITLALFILLIKSYKNLLFLGTIICNTLIGIITELKSKRIIDKLTLIEAEKVKVIRDNEVQEIDANKIVKDDIIMLSPGKQVICDSIVIDSTFEVNESLITGEIDPIKKEIGDELLSGSYILTGKGLAKVKNVGENNYTSKIIKEAKYEKKNISEIMTSLKKIIKLISYIIIPIGIIFFIKQINIESNTLPNAVINTTAALIAIIPDGLMLLTSTVMSISVIRLSRYNVLIQQLYSIENLARVDTICFDKTGTLTKGKMQVVDFIKQKEINEDTLKEIFGKLDNDNLTMRALIKKYGKKDTIEAKKIIPFSSSRKYSAVTLQNKTYILGAPEIILKRIPISLEKIINNEEEYRVILLAESRLEITDDNLPRNIDPIGIFLIQDEIRKEAKKAINYFEKNDVDVKIISGDNPKTVSRIAKKLELSFYDNYIDVSNIDEKELKEVALKYNIFGRVRPEQKKIIVKSLQENKHTVAMTGDGVNDVLSLKQSDCAISLSTSCEAARNVSELVLLDSNFNSLPKIVKEGRRTINNIERSASLFITKTLYATLLLVLFLFVKNRYPYMPIQLTLISVFTIGIPSFILALEPNNEKVKPNFLFNISKVAFPTSITVVINTILILLASSILNLKDIDTSTLAVLLLATTGFMHIYKISLPLNKLRLSLLIALITTSLICIIFFTNLFSLSPITINLIAIYLVLALFSYLIFNIITKLFTECIFKK